VAGDVTLRARIAARLLGIGGRSDVEVFEGEREPLLRRGRFSWFGHEGEALAVGPSSPVRGEPAAQRIVRAAREEAGLQIVAIGPMTNLARALALDPELPSRVAGLTIMGGHIRRVAIGRTVFAPGIDYNLCSDPEASLAVLGAGFATTLVPADVTLQTWMGAADVDALARGGPLARALCPLVRIWATVQHKLFSGLGGEMDPDNQAYLHDPLTVLALSAPSALGFEALRIVPTIEGGVLRTLEVAPSVGIGTTMRVATSVDAQAARRAIVEALTRV
jgi:inosine-uridine nucleoside N-ribohydrolase